MTKIDEMVTVADAAKILDRSIEQVRRYLREGKLPGERIGQQWFVKKVDLESRRDHRKYQEQLDLLEEIRRNRDAIYRETGRLFDGAEAVRESREERLKRLGSGWS